MSKLKKERLNQMIENALSYKQESKQFNSDFLQKKLKGFSLKPKVCLLYTSPSPRDRTRSRMPSSA